jgi:hypothetical protein
MLTFEPFHAEHLKYIRPAAVQSDDYRFLQTPGAQQAFETGPALSAWASGLCLGAAGVIMPYSGRGEAWAILSDHARHYLKPIIYKMRAVLDDLPMRRIDMAVLVSNKQGHALARALKFEYEATLEALHVSGEDMAIYKRIKQKWQPQLH